MVYFAVEDADDAVARAQELGGKVAVPPTDTPAGRFAVLNDPHGAVFSIITLAARPDEQAQGATEAEAQPREARAQPREGEAQARDGQTEQAAEERPPDQQRSRPS